jgi:hypothetical protein
MSKGFWLFDSIFPEVIAKPLRGFVPKLFAPVQYPERSTNGDQAIACDGR